MHGLKRILPDIPVILYSGYAERLRDKPREEFPFNAFVMKPLVVSELTKAIRSVVADTGAMNEGGFPGAT